MMKFSTPITIIALLTITLLFSGCKNNSIYSSEQKAQKHNRVTNINMMLLEQDIDRFLLLDRPSRLSHWLIMAE